MKNSSRGAQHGSSVVIACGGGEWLLRQSLLQRDTLSRVLISETSPQDSSITHIKVEKAPFNWASFRRQVKAVVASHDLVMIIVEFDGGRGSSFAHVIAKMAKEIRALVVAMVIMPVCWQGKKARILAGEMQHYLHDIADVVSIVERDILLECLHPKLGINEAYMYFFETHMAPLLSLPGIMDKSGYSNAVFSATIKDVLRHSGRIVAAKGRGIGQCAGMMAAQGMLSNTHLSKKNMIMIEKCLAYVEIGPAHKQKWCVKQQVMNTLKAWVSMDMIIHIHMCINRELNDLVEVTMFAPIACDTNQRWRLKRKNNFMLGRKFEYVVPQPRV